MTASYVFCFVGHDYVGSYSKIMTVLSDISSETTVCLEWRKASTEMECAMQCSKSICFNGIIYTDDKTCCCLYDTGNHSILDKFS